MSCSWASKAGGGTGGRVPLPVEKSAGDIPPEIIIFQYLFLKYICSFAFFNIFEIKWPKSEEKLSFGGRLAWVPMNPSPQTKLGGDAPGPVES